MKKSDENLSNEQLREAWYKSDMWKAIASKGGYAYAAMLTKEQRSERARIASKARWARAKNKKNKEENNGN